MRFVNISSLRQGMVSGQDIVDASGHMILKKNTRLSLNDISYLSFIGIQGLYINDEFSKDVEIREVVRPEIRRTALRIVHEFFQRGAAQTIPDDERAVREIVQQVVNDVLENQNVMYNLVEIRTYDDYTYCHSVNVGVLAGVIGVKCGLDRPALEDLVTAGFLHDVGKVFIDPDIIHAPRRLTDTERIRMMEHPRLGYEFLTDKTDFSEAIRRTVLEHHEWFNGSGYPSRKRGDGILKSARILKAADVYDAMTTKRPYHPPYLPSEVMEYIMGRSGMEFDPDVVSVMARSFCIYPAGCEVELSDGRRAIVVGNHEGYVLRPSVRVTDTGDIIDLNADRNAMNITITRVMM